MVLSVNLMPCFSLGSRPSVSFESVLLPVSGSAGLCSSSLSSLAAVAALFSFGFPCCLSAGLSRWSSAEAGFAALGSACISGCGLAGGGADCALAILQDNAAAQSKNAVTVETRRTHPPMRRSLACRQGLSPSHHWQALCVF